MEDAGTLPTDLARCRSKKLIESATESFALIKSYRPFLFLPHQMLYCRFEVRVQQGEHPFPFPLGRLAWGRISNLREGISCTEDVCAIVSCLQPESIRNEGMLYRFSILSQKEHNETVRMGSQFQILELCTSSISG